MVIQIRFANLNNHHSDKKKRLLDLSSSLFAITDSGWTGWLAGLPVVLA
jgi:hypothetical protein